MCCCSFVAVNDSIRDAKIQTVTSRPASRSNMEFISDYIKLYLRSRYNNPPKKSHGKKRPGGPCTDTDSNMTLSYSSVGLKDSLVVRVSHIKSDIP